MGKINFARMFLGGLLAGLIINIFEYVLNGVVFGSQWDAFEKALGRQMRLAPFPSSSLLPSYRELVWFGCTP
jgi:hypothetical protein